MKTPTELRNSIYKKKDYPNKLKNLKKRKNIIKGDPNDLINLSWEKEINPLDTFKQAVR